MKLQIKRVYTVGGKDFKDVKEARKAQAKIDLEAILGKQVLESLTNEQMATVASALNVIRKKKAVTKKVAEAPATEVAV